MSYRIKTVAEMTGIARNTLIAWERRYSFVVPTRAANGYRVYSDTDVQRLYEIKSLLEQGFKISEAVRLLTERGTGLEPVTPGSTGEDGVSIETSLREGILEALLKYDQGEAARLSSRLGLVPYEDQLDEVWFPLMREVGDGWHQGRISVVQEHFCTSFCTNRLRSMLLNVQGAVNGPRTVVLVGMSGERHELGLIGLAIRFSLRGWKVVYLGMDTPTVGIATFLSQQTPDLACISAVMSHTAEEIHALAGTIHAMVPSSVRIVIGGGGVPENLCAIHDNVAYHRQSATLLSSSWVTGEAAGEE